MKLKRKNVNAQLALLFIFITLITLLFSSSLVSANSTIFTAEADAFVLAEQPHMNTGSMPILRANASTEMNAYLRMNVQNIEGEVNGAFLRLRALDTNSNSFHVHQVNDNGWDESVITYENAPAIGDVIATYADGVQRGQWISIDVSSVVTGNGLYTFALTTESNTRLRWHARENRNAPELIVHVNAASTPQPTNTAVPTLTPTVAPSQTSQPTATMTATAQPTDEPTAVPTNTATAVPTQPPTPTATQPPSNPGSIVVNHTSVDLFHHIPEQYLQAAANMNMLFIGRSVSANIDDGLNCLSYPSTADAPNHCKRVTHRNPDFSVNPSVVSWERANGYDRSNWVYQPWAGQCSSWFDKVNCFIEMTENSIDQYDVVSLQYSYLAVDTNSTIADQPGGYFWDNPNRMDVYDQELYEAQHPDTIFIYSTANLARAIGSQASEDFNNQMRQYALENNKPLFDIADILSHDPDGDPCFDNRDGIPYSNGNQSENHHDDGRNYHAICPHYTSETDGGHLGNVSAGKIRVAQAYWVFMAQLAGWDGTTE